MKIKKNPRNCRQQKSGSWAFFRFFSARRRHLSWVYLFQEISLYRAYGQEDTTKRIVMNLKAMLLTGLFILLKYTVSSSQRLVLSNCSYLTLTFLACQEVFLFFLIFIFDYFFEFSFHLWRTASRDRIRSRISAKIIPIPARMQTKIH